MRHKAIFPILALIATASLCVTTAQIAYAQQQPIKRTDLLKTHLAEIEGKEMHVWVADIAPGATTGSHFHPTPRFVYVLEGAVILELDGKPPQTSIFGTATRAMKRTVGALRQQALKLGIGLGHRR